MSILSELTAISPIDGRYRTQVAVLSDFFSEYSLFKYRVKVEIEYLIALSNVGLPELPSFTEEQKRVLRDISIHFSENDAERIKELERKLNHDVKAVEYFLKDKVGEALGEAIEFIHFGLTSQDINNTAIPLSVNAAFQTVLFPSIESLHARLMVLAHEWKHIPMLAHTHGQPASPTSVGKEILVFCERLEGQVLLLRGINIQGKFGGATGNFNAHYAAYPDIDWPSFADNFLAGLGIERQKTTTQIEHYDHLAAIFDTCKRINTILIDLAKDMWLYISMNYFTQKVQADEVGSSAMPHKVNPIDFENAEGNLGLANTLLEFLSNKLPVSRLQRDLTDSTVLRNIGVAFAHSLLAYKSLQRGIAKIELNGEQLHQDLEQNWAVVAEGIQTILRREGFDRPYEALKNLTRGKSSITKGDLHSFIDTLRVKEEVKLELKKLSPHHYTGNACV